MPYEVTYEYGTASALVVWSGTIATKEIFAALNDLRSHDSFASRRYEIWNFTNATDVQVASSEVRMFAQRDSDISERNPRMKIAIVGESSLFQGLDELFHIFERVWTTWQSRTFRSVEEARQWAAEGTEVG